MIAFTMGEKHPKLCLSWAVMLTKAQVRHFFVRVKLHRVIRNH